MSTFPEPVPKDPEETPSGQPSPVPASDPLGPENTPEPPAEWTGEPENREPRKHAEVRWVDADAIPEEFVETTASALHHYLTGGPQVSLDGWK